MISSNILPNILPEKIYIAFERKIPQKKNASGDSGAVFFLAFLAKMKWWRHTFLSTDFLAILNFFRTDYI
jgi:hypothetical protein